MQEFAEQLATRVQLTTDGFHFYRRQVEDAFGEDVDFTQLVKLYGDYGQHDSESKYPQIQSWRLYPKCGWRPRP